MFRSFTQGAQRRRLVVELDLRPEGSSSTTTSGGQNNAWRWHRACGIPNCCSGRATTGSTAARQRWAFAKASEARSQRADHDALHGRGGPLRSMPHGPGKIIRWGHAALMVAAWAVQFVELRRSRAGPACDDRVARGRSRRPARSSYRLRIDRSLSSLSGVLAEWSDRS